MGPRLVDAAERAPFQCPCGETHGPFVDTDQDMLSPGRIYRCLRCKGAEARLVGFVPLVEYEALQDQHAIATADVQRLYAELDAAHKKITSGDVERLHEQVEQLTQQLDSMTSRAFTAERSVANLERGKPMVELAESLRAIGADYAAPPEATKTKEKAA